LWIRWGKEAVWRRSKAGNTWGGEGEMLISYLLVRKRNRGR
jgi:hypothetical protein